MSAQETLRLLHFHLRDLLAIAKDHERRQVEQDLKQLVEEIKALENKP